MLRGYSLYPPIKGLTDFLILKKLISFSRLSEILLLEQLCISFTFERKIFSIFCSIAEYFLKCETQHNFAKHSLSVRAAFIAAIERKRGSVEWVLMINKYVAIESLWVRFKFRKNNGIFEVLISWNPFSNFSCDFVYTIWLRKIFSYF